MIHDVEAGGSAEQAGLQIGDFIVELEGEPVDTLSGEEVLARNESLKLLSFLACLVGYSTGQAGSEGAS